MSNINWKGMALMGALPAAVAFVSPGLALLMQLVFFVDLALRSAPSERDTVAPPLPARALWTTLGVLFIASLLPVFLIVPTLGACKVGQNCATGIMLVSLAIILFLFGSYLSLKTEYWRRTFALRAGSFIFGPRTAAKVAAVFILLFSLIYQVTYWQKMRVGSEGPRSALPDIDFTLVHGLAFILAVGLVRAVRLSRDSEI